MNTQKRRYWLLKSEPDSWSWSQQCDRGERGEWWDGVRNYQARNMMRDQMSVGDQIFFYHSNCDVPGIVGIAKVASKSYPDPTAFDPDDKHYDPKSDPDNPRWFLVDVRYVKKFRKTVSLADLKANPALDNLALVRKGNRLSVMPVGDDEWASILEMV